MVGLYATYEAGNDLYSWRSPFPLLTKTGSAPVSSEAGKLWFDVGIDANNYGFAVVNGGSCLVAVGACDDQGFATLAWVWFKWQGDD